MHNDALILSGVRTPIGSMGGSLSTVAASKLGAVCIKAALERAGLASDEVDEVIMGNVVSAGLGQNPARQAAMQAGLPPKVSAMTINKVCGSGLKAVMLADQSIRLGDCQTVIAGGMESMSLAPYLLPQARAGYRMGHGRLLDSVIHDGLWDAYGDKHMGSYGEVCAAKYGFSKKDQDDFAVRSYERARKATDDGVFQDEVVPIEVQDRKGSTWVSEDEEPARFDEEKLRELKSVFSKDGTITAGNASSINDGAAALVIASDAKSRSLREEPLARIVGAATYSREPEWFTIAPIGALKKLMDKISWSVDQTDLFEINEAFAAVTMAAERELAIPAEKVNIYGGAVALGHPIGASGARILVTLLTGLKRTGARRGIACLCIGGGEAVAVAVERVNPNRSPQR